MKPKYKDVEIARIWGIPLQTLAAWKRRPDDNWRKKIYLSLKHNKVKPQKIGNDE